MHITHFTIDPDSFPTREAYPFSLELLQNTRDVELSTPATIFVGENGTGKSTLLEALARSCGIHIWEGLHRTRYRNNPHERTLSRHVRVRWRNGPVPGSFFAAELFRNFSQIVDEWASTDAGVLSYYGSESLMEQSHGEGHMAYFHNRYGIEGLYFLDEPENALSPRRQMELLELLVRMCAEGHAQFLIATHSPILLSLPGATILDFNGPELRRIGLSDCDHIQVYREFLSGL